MGARRTVTTRSPPPGQFGDEIRDEAYNTRQMSFAPSSEINIEPSGSYIFPQHFGTYRETEDEAFWMHGYPDGLKLRLSAELQKRYHKLSLGGMFEIR